MNLCIIIKLLFKSGVIDTETLPDALHYINASLLWGVGYRHQ